MKGLSKLRFEYKKEKEKKMKLLVEFDIHIEGELEAKKIPGLFEKLLSSLKDLSSYEIEGIDRWYLLVKKAKVVKLEEKIFKAKL